MANVLFKDTPYVIFQNTADVIWDSEGGISIIQYYYSQMRLDNMYELKTNTAKRIVVGPMVDPSDGKTAETALDVTALTVQIYQMKNDGTAVLRTEFTPTASGGDNDMTHVTGDTAGMYDLELTAAQLNFLGAGRILFYDIDGFLVHWIDILVVSAAYFNWKYGSVAPDVNAASISGSVADDIANDVLDELLSEHTAAGSVGKAIGDLEDVVGGSGGTGNITWTYTLTNSITGGPIEGATVWVTSDIAGATTIASGLTNSSGVVTFYLSPGTVYVWRQCSGYSFVNPDVEVVS